MAIFVTGAESPAQAEAHPTKVEWFVDSLERRSWRWVLAFLAVFIAVLAVRAARDPLWYDEIITFYMAQQPSVGELIRAIREGCDNSPPLYALIARGAQALFGRGGLAMRLPSLVGYCTMCLCVFAFARRRMSPVYATLAVLIAASATLPFAAEAHPYGLVLGCVGVTLICWQSATEGQNRRLAIPGLALSLAIGTAAHYYTVFVVAPLFAAEVVRWRARRKLDLAVLAALVASPLVLVAHMPLIEAASAFIPYYWAKLPQPPAYPFFLSRIALVCSLGLLSFFLLRMLRGKSMVERRLNKPGLLIHESVAASVFVLLPGLVFLCTRFTTRIFQPRYAASMVFGVAILVPVIIDKLSRGNVRVVISAMLALLGYLAGMVVVKPMLRPAASDGALLKNDLASLPATNLPIVITPHHAYFELFFYAGKELRDRIVHVNDPGMDRRYLGTDTDALNLAALSRRVPLNVPDYKAFLKGVPHFLLVTNGKDWLPGQLLRSGYTFRSIRGSSTSGIFEVRSPSIVE